MTRTISELTPAERAFCRYRARGSNATQAYRLAWNRPKLNSNSASSRAAEVARRPRVIGHLKSLFREAKKSDLISHAEYVDSLIADHVAAKAADNWTAAASFQRLIGQSINSLTDTVVVEDRLSDEQLLERLGAGASPEVVAHLKHLIGAKDTFH